MNKSNQVTVSVDEANCFIPGSSLQHEVRCAMSEYIQKKQEQIGSFYRQGKIREAQELCDTIKVLMAFKVDYVEDKK